jgi:colanic acid/amylovoran biosynthesis glycosyltransferase
MKVAFIVGEFPRLNQTFIMDQFRALMRRGHVVDVISLVNGSGRDAVIDPRMKTVAALAVYLDRGKFGFRAAMTAGWHTQGGSRGYRARQRLARAISLLRGKQYDVVHAHFGNVGLEAVDMLECGAIRGPMVVTFYGKDATVEPQHLNYSPLWSRAAFILPISQFIEGLILEAGAPQQKIILHRIGVNLDEFPMIERDDWMPPFDVLAVGRLTRQKGFDVLIRAMALLDFPATLIIVGGRQQGQDVYTELTRLARALGVRCIIEPNCENVMDFYRAADVVVIPSVTASNGLAEGQCRVALEAMACGLPVIATRNGALGEVVPARWIVPENDPWMIAEKLRGVYRNCEFGGSQTYRGMIEASHDNAKLTDRLVEIYDAARAC